MIFNTGKHRPEKAPYLSTFYAVLYTWSRDLNSDYALKNSLFEGVKLAKNPNLDKYILVVMLMDLIHCQNFHYLTVA